MPLRRADRLFDILRVLCAASRPVTAASLADELEVTVRTVYRISPRCRRGASRSRARPGLAMYCGAASSCRL
jgi:predicted DNA-binding transcriptional regulator YafY